ncbi:MAG: KOW motif-containing protein [Alloprevotella sp.]|nr:KOW motif-containing protein [Alloprevotella sp.]
MSGENVPAWYVVRGVFGKAADLHRHLQSVGRESFFPMCYRKKGITKKTVPAIPNLCFVRGTHREVMAIIDAPVEEMHGLSQYLAPCKDVATKEIMCVPDGEMKRFMDAFTIIGEEAVWLDPKTLNLKKGDHVRVIGGQFEGVEGYIKRIFGQQRVIVTLQDFAAIATAYVPTPLVERIGEE